MLTVINMKYKIIFQGRHHEHFSSNIRICLLEWKENEKKENELYDMKLILLYFILN